MVLMLRRVGQRSSREASRGIFAENKATTDLTASMQTSLCESVVAIYAWNH
jgi:hypothetical protein